MKEILINNDKRFYEGLFKNTQISKNEIQTDNYNFDYKSSYRDERFASFKRATLCLLVTFLVMSCFDGLLAEVTGDLRDSMVKVKDDVWSYMYLVKIGAFVMGIILSAVKQSPMPFGMGIGTVAGVHFFGEVLDKGKAFLI